MERGFELPILDDTSRAELENRARRLRAAILTMTTLAASGHPGGSMSSLELYLTLFHFADIDPAHPRAPHRDRIVVSHGHTSPGVYCALADAGFFSLDDAVAHFRQAGSVFEGHVERSVPGVEWGTGNLGQGLSAGVGFAIASRLTGHGYRTFVVMSDGEQHKGQVAEARRMAVKERLNDLTVLVDCNGIQISGHTAHVMPVNIADGFVADGWGVLEVDGHDIGAVYAAVARAVADTERPVAIIAHTTIGKGVSFMEGDPEFHGRGLNADEYLRACVELGVEPTLDAARARRGGMIMTPALHQVREALDLDEGTPREYTRDKHTDNRSAWGTALADVALANPGLPMAVLDCDLAASVKTGEFGIVRPQAFIQAGVGEHNAAAVAGALSASGVLTFFSDFGVFGIDEVYNQQRLNDINEASLKLAVTHCGLDVGEDGKTHQCLDYVGAFRSMFGWRVIVPADPNQTDRAVREAARMPGCVAIAMGRSKLPVILDHEGSPLFGDGYSFEYGVSTWAREGEDIVIVTMGTVAGAAVDAADSLRDEGVSAGVCIVSSPLDLDADAMERVAAAPWVLVAEDHGWRTGLWASVAEWLVLNDRRVAAVPLGVDGYQSSGAASELFARAGLDRSGIAQRVRELLAR
ncbi:MAG: transketolase [Coriobacteriia bacterium]|nr:transketolase [Coriobacteriia bacterium]MBN2847736.1 transketolase [Coriobacteriia bacterium]